MHSEAIATQVKPWHSKRPGVASVRCTLKPLQRDSCAKTPSGRRCTFSVHLKTVAATLLVSHGLSGAVAPLRCTRNSLQQWIITKVASTRAGCIYSMHLNCVAAAIRSVPHLWTRMLHLCDALKLRCGEVRVARQHQRGAVTSIRCTSSLLHLTQLWCRWLCRRGTGPENRPSAASF